MKKDKKCNVCGGYADTEYEEPYLCMGCAVEMNDYDEVKE